MKIFPAVDLSGGRIVRLYQGDYDKMTVYNNNPKETAKLFRDAGAKYLHLVDLDGAKDGSDANFESIKQIAGQGGLYIEVGGGIRDEDRIKKYLNLGVSRCILGTIAVKDFDFTAEMIKKYKNQIAVGVDARDGFVAIQGWREVSQIRGVEFCEKLAKIGTSAIIYTDIARDGAEFGTNLNLYRDLIKIRGPEFTASGGVSGLDELKKLRDMGVHAAIIGKALYTGKLNLREILQELGME